MNAHHCLARSLIVSLCVCACRLAAADKPADTNAAWLAEHYTKHEHRIPMRDGVRLFTRVYVPKDDSHEQRGGNWEEALPA
jgi:predicted acyl esterase